jgi:hypothetical protein
MRGHEFVLKKSDKTREYRICNKCGFWVWFYASFPQESGEPGPVTYNFPTCREWLMRKALK